VDTQNPVVLGEDSEPQPDSAILKPRTDFYAGRHPGPEDVLLLVEVADTSAAFDRSVKVPLYVRHGIPELWLVDLAAKLVEVYRVPRPEFADYQHIERRHDGTLSAAAAPATALSVAELFTA
jgi:Uma2 family endonuclease